MLFLRIHTSCFPLLDCYLLQGVMRPAIPVFPRLCFPFFIWPWLSGIYIFLCLLVWWTEFCLFPQLICFGFVSIALLLHACVSDPLQPHGLQPCRLPCPLDFPGKNTVGCYFYFRGSSQLRIKSQSPMFPALAGRFFTAKPLWKPNLKKIFLIFGCAGSSMLFLLAAMKLGQGGLLSSWGVQASAVTAHGFNSCSSWALRHRLSGCGAWTSLLLGLWDPPLTRDWTGISCTGRWILYQWATRKALPPPPTTHMLKP